MTTNALIAVGVILMYFILNALVIRKFHVKQDTLSEYAVGNRSFGWLLACFSYLGGWYVGSIYTGWFGGSADLGMFMQYIILYSTGSLVILFLMAKTVWVWGKIFDLETQADIIQLRYGSKSFKVLFAILTFLFWAPWMVLEIKTIGYVISAATYQSFNFNVGMIIVTVFIIAYSFYGGIRASAIGNLVQGVTFTFLGTILLYALIVKAYGGVIPLFKSTMEFGPQLLTLQGVFGGNLWTSSILTGIFGAFCWPGVFTSIYRADSPKSVKKAVFVAPLVGIVLMLFILLLGLGGRMIDGFPADAQAGIFWIGDHFLGPVGLALVGILALAACMSTISPMLNVASVLMAKDFGSLAKNASKESILLFAKVGTIMVGLIVLFVATIPLPNLFTIALVMYDCIVQAIVPILLGIFWRKGHVYGAAVGMLTGIAIVFYTNLVPGSIAWANGWSGGMLGLGVNLLLYVVISFILPQQKHIEDLYAALEAYNLDDNVTKMFKPKYSRKAVPSGCPSTIYVKSQNL